MSDIPFDVASNCVNDSIISVRGFGGTVDSAATLRKEGIVDSDALEALREEILIQVGKKGFLLSPPSLDLSFSAKVHQVMLQVIQKARFGQ